MVGVGAILVSYLIKEFENQQTIINDILIDKIIKNL
jgi:hypothetical protein